MIVTASLVFFTVSTHHTVTQSDIYKTNISVVQRVSSLPPTTRLIALARKWAGTYWRGTRCLSIAYNYHWLPGRTIAKSYWSFDPAAPTKYLTCSITFNPQRIREGFFLYCAAVVHEFGHLSGFYEKGGPNNGAHSSNPYNIMYPILTQKNIPKTCKKSSV